jgi:hypothetical protein
MELLASYWTIAGGAQPHTDRDYSPLDFRDRVAAAARAGYRGPYGIEVLNAEMRGWPLEKLTMQAYETTMAQFEDGRR